MLEVIRELIGEFLLQATIQLLGEPGLHSIAERFREIPNPWLASVGYVIFGAIGGGISLLVFPNHIVGKSLRQVNLVFVPVAVGILMASIGWWPAKHGMASRLGK